MKMIYCHYVVFGVLLLLAKLQFVRILCAFRAQEMRTECAPQNKKRSFKI